VCIIVGELGRGTAAAAVFLLDSGEAARRILASGGGRIVHITPTVVSTTLSGYTADPLNKTSVETSTKIVAKEVAKEIAKETKYIVAVKADNATNQIKGGGVNPVKSGTNQRGTL
jgi:hypothetical protein